MLSCEFKHCQSLIQALVLHVQPFDGPSHLLCSTCQAVVNEKMSLKWVVCIRITDLAGVNEVCYGSREEMC